MQNKAPNFKIFIGDELTQNKIRQLFQIRNGKPLDHTILNKIDEVGLHEHLENFKFAKGAKPRLYVNRLILMMFIEVMTTIANPTDLKKVAKLLDVKAIKFPRIQFQIREKVNDILKEENIMPQTEFEAATIAWHILNVELSKLK